MRWPGRRLCAAAAILWIAAAGFSSVQGQTGAQDATSVPPGVTSIPVLYLTRDDGGGARDSLSEPVIGDYGWQGARFGIQELNRGGQFLGRHYELKRISVAPGGDLPAAARAAFGIGQGLVIADLGAADLLSVADLPDFKQALILDARSSDDELRQKSCRDNVFHVLPNWAMRADALAQFSAGRHWKRWLLLTGGAPADQAYARALERAAAQVGIRIVSRRQYVPGSGPVAARLLELTHVSEAYDWVLVADTRDVFGESLMFNTWDPRPVAGTQGLTAVAWNEQFREYAARGIEYRFYLLASRTMTERDYGNWLAATIIGEAVTRSGSSDAAVLRRFVESENFSVPANKGEGLTFRPWDHQLRQPLLLFGAHQLVSMWPQDTGQGGRLETDRLGFDASRSLCRLGANPT